jgi:membrane protease YdiL (CAAX protease family)
MAEFLKGITLWKNPPANSPGSHVLVALVVIGCFNNCRPVIKATLFSGVDWYFDTDFAKYSREALIVTAWVRLGLDGFVLPITEELFFRGFLFDRLPGTTRTKWFSGALLFAIYHFWQPWNYVSIFLISLVLIWPVVKFRNVYLSIAIHMSVNIMGSIAFFGQILQARE